MMNNAQELVISFEPASGASAISKISPVSFIFLWSHRRYTVVIWGKEGKVKLANTRTVRISVLRCSPYRRRALLASGHKYNIPIRAGAQDLRSRAWKASPMS